MSYIRGPLAKFLSQVTLQLCNDVTFPRYLRSVSPQNRVELMTGQTTSKPTCVSCGTEVPLDAPQGYCLKCLFALGTAEVDSLAGESPSQLSTLDSQATP